MAPYAWGYMAPTPSPSALGSFRTRYPHLNISISAGDRLVDLVREGIDCVVRIGMPKDSTLVGRRIASLQEVVCASPAYIERLGAPQHPEELAQHQAVTFFASDHTVQYPFSFIINGKTVDISATGWLSVNEADCYTEAALRGYGIIQVPRFRAEQYLRSGELIELLQEWPAPALPVSVLYPYHSQLSPRVKVFVEWVTGIYAEQFPEK